VVAVFKRNVAIDRCPIKRLIEGVGVLDLHQNLEHTAIGGDLVALDHMLLFGMRGPVPVEIAHEYCSTPPAWGASLQPGLSTM
jgi:hypothetical protein